MQKLTQLIVSCVALWLILTFLGIAFYLGIFLFLGVLIYASILKAKQFLGAFNQKSSHHFQDIIDMGEVEIVSPQSIDYKDYVWQNPEGLDVTISYQKDGLSQQKKMMILGIYQAQDGQYMIEGLERQTGKKLSVFAQDIIKLYTTNGKNWNFYEFLENLKS